VLADCSDLDAAARAVAMGIFNNQGQVCNAGSRLIVEAKIERDLVDRVVAIGKALEPRDPLDPATKLGAIVSREQLDRVVGYVEDGKSQGAHLRLGGHRVLEETGGYYMQPTVFEHVDRKMRIAQEEIFGPVISAIPFKDVDDLIARANSTMFGLGSGVWTRDVSKAHHLAKAIRAGSVWVNCYQTMDPAVPFGGYKMSGYGRESGLQHLEEYLNVKAVWIKTA